MLKKEHVRLTSQIQGVSAALAAFGATYKNGTGTRRTMSAAGRAKIAAAQRARWAKVKGKSGNSTPLWFAFQRLSPSREAINDVILEEEVSPVVPRCCA